MPRGMHGGKYGGPFRPRRSFGAPNTPGFRPGRGFPAGPPAPDRPGFRPGDAEKRSVRERLYSLGRRWGDTNYDAASKLVAWEGRSLVRESLWYARVLLDTGAAADAEKAAGILDAALAAGLDGCGAWGGASLVQVLRRHQKALPVELAGKVEAAARERARHEMTRWVAPSLSAEALLSAYCMACGGDWLNDAALSRAGRAKLAEVHTCILATGSFDEFNCPEKSAYALHAISALMTQLPEAGLRGTAEALWRDLWESLLERAHPALGQLAGPFLSSPCRDVRTTARGTVKYYLARALEPTFPLGVVSDGTPADLFPALTINDASCPEDLVKRWRRLPMPRQESALADSSDLAAGLPGFRLFPPLGTAKGSPEAWGELAASKGNPGRPVFNGTVVRAVTWLGKKHCIGTLSASDMSGASHPFVAHWYGPERARTSHLACLVLREDGGVLTRFRGAVMCAAQEEGRVLLLVRFGLDPEDRGLPKAPVVKVAFLMNKDAQAEVVSPGSGSLDLAQGAVVRSGDMYWGARLIKARMSKAVFSASIEELQAPEGPVGGETAVVFTMAPVDLSEGEVAWAAFSFQMGEEMEIGGIPGLVGSLRQARLAAEDPSGSQIRLAWGSTLGMETGVKVMDCRSWLAREGAVR